MDKECERTDLAGEFRAGERDDNFLRLPRRWEIGIIEYALNDDARGILLGNHRGEGVHRRGGDIAVGNHCCVDHIRTLLDDGLCHELKETMKLLEGDWLSDGNYERSVAVYVLTKEDALCPGLSGEVHFAPLHRDLPRCGFARCAGLRPDHLDGEKIAGD